MTATTQPTAPNARTGRKRNEHRRLFLVDPALTLAFVLVINVPLTGLAIHEWLGLFLGLGTIVHLVQHGGWVASICKRFLASSSLMNRLNFVMLGLLFGAYGTIIVSGVVISEVALPFLGVVPSAGDFWLWLHVSSVVATIWLTALHVAFNWTWIRNAVNKYVVAPVTSVAGRRRP